MSAGAIGVFDYPVGTHVRRHGPQGYLDYKHYKPWLRDEFSFRCVYCLCRETWFPDGDVAAWVSASAAASGEKAERCVVTVEV
jgi:hypothetical protein